MQDAVFVDLPITQIVQGYMPLGLILGLFGLFKKLVLKLLSNLTLENILEDVVDVGLLENTLTLHSFM